MDHSSDMSANSDQTETVGDLDRPHSRQVFERPVEVLEPLGGQTVPLVFSSPHSGSIYPKDFIAASRLDPLTLRRSEDSFIDELYESAPDHGAPLLRALFPRAYLDPNREAFELDPTMYSSALPDGTNIGSPRVAGGLGTVARVVCDGHEIYRDPLEVEEALWRIEHLYMPYHRTLKALLDSTVEQFGYAVLIDCHSMPSIGGPMDRDTGLARTDMVLGDYHGQAAAPQLIDLVENHLSGKGFKVERNMPYAGGFITQHYGRPAEHKHTLQIEINRALYMNERTIVHSAGFERLKEQISDLVALLAEHAENGTLISS